MRGRTVGLIVAVVLSAAAGAWWAAVNLAAGPFDQLVQRAYTYLAVGATQEDTAWVGEAADLMARAAAIDPGSAEAHLVAGMAYAVLGESRLAIEHYRAAAQIAPKLPVDALIGDVYFELGEWEQAEAAYLQALAIDPDSVLALRGLARLAELTGRTAAAADYLQRIVAVTAPDPGASIELARFYLRMLQPELALQALEAVAQEHRTGAAYFAQLGFVYEALSRVDDACRELQTALRLGSDDRAVPAAIERLACSARN